MRVIKLQNLDLTFHQFLIVVYQQTGVDFVELYSEVTSHLDLELVRVFKVTFFEHLKDCHFELTRIFGDVTPYRDKFLSSKHHQINSMYLRCRNLLVDFKIHQVSLEIVQFKLDARDLLTQSPPLFEYFQTKQLNLN